jgi:hypothetical protein
MDEENEEIDAARMGWLDSPITVRARAVYTDSRNVLALQLLSHARQSSDPAVRAGVAALEQADGFLHFLGGKPFKDLFPVRRK